MSQSLADSVEASPAPSQEGEREMQRASRFYALLSQVNQSVVHASSRQELFDQVCQAAVTAGAFSLAWIGWIDRELDSIRPVAFAGAAADYLKGIAISCRDTPEGKGAIGSAAREGKLILINDVVRDPRAAGWRDQAARFGLAACAAAPIRIQGQVAGVLAVYAGETGVFGSREARLFEDIGSDLSFALEMMRRDAERRDAEAALRESEIRFRTLIESAPDAIFVHTEGKIVFVNDAAVHLFGANGAQQLIGRLALELVHPDDRALVAARVAANLAHQKAVPLHEHRYLRIDGSPIIVEVTAAPIHYQQLPSAAVFVRDITERSALRNRLQQQGALLDGANDAMLVCDLSCRVLYCNQSAERLYGRNAAEIVNMPIGELLAPAAFSPDIDYRCALETGGWSGEVQRSTPGGGPITVFSRWTLIRDELGQPKALFGIETDVSEHKRLESQFLRAQRMENVGQLAGGIAHDLNNVLAPVMIGAELLRLESTSPATTEMIRTIEGCAKRGAEIVRQILQFARGSGGGRTELSVLPLLNEIARLIRGTFPKRISLETAFPADLWSVHGDPTQLHQLLMNLCVNARDAMPERGFLRLAAENVVLDAASAQSIPGATPGAYVAWTVGDTGSGISPENLKKIFDPFFTTKAAGHGTGLGLSTVIGIVRSHGGAIKVESKVDHGTQFRVYLPALSAGPSRAADPAEAEDTLAARGETVLVVDDEESVRLMMQRVLELAGYRVLTAADGAEALALVSRGAREIQAVITDLMMPTMDGFSLGRILQRVAPHLKLITCSGMDEQFSGRQPPPNICAGLKKPLRRPHLLATLRAVLDGAVLAPEHFQTEAMT